MEEEKTSIFKKWWFLVCIVLIVCGIITFVILNNNKEIQTDTKTQLTAEEITNKLKEKGLNIGKIVVYTEETDTNNLLGRPNSYISKTVFADTRLKQPNMTKKDIKEQRIS